jgi:hypothetical protein
MYRSSEVHMDYLSYAKAHDYLSSVWKDGKKIGFYLY